MYFLFYQKISMLKRRHTGSLCYGEGRRQELLQKTCSFRALGELQLAFYLYQHEQIDYCRPQKGMATILMFHW